jgi:hypothetical protein
VDFKLDESCERVWTPAEAEAEISEKGLGRPCRRWIEGDFLVYLLAPRVPANAELGWQKGSGSVTHVLSGSALGFTRPRGHRRGWGHYAAERAHGPARG